MELNTSNLSEAESSDKTSSQLSDQKPFYLPELDILRFFAFFLVFIHHALPEQPEFYQEKLKVSFAAAKWFSSIVVAGGFGVDLFFALSAFLITELLVREYEKRGKINFWAFYVRRGLRIYPLYYTFILLTIFVFPYFFQDALNYPHNVGFLVFAANWTCAFLNYPKSVAAPLWSVSIEEQFYFACPILFRLVGIKRIYHLAVGLIILAVCTRIFLIYSDSPSYSIWFNTFARLDPIAGGILLAILLRNGVIKKIRKWQTRVLICLTGIALSLVATRYGFLDERGIVVVYFIIALSSVLIIWSVIHPQKIDENRYRFLTYLGRISYGLYVFHLLGLIIAENSAVYFGKTGFSYVLWRFAGGLLLTVALSVLSYTFLETPFLKLKKKFTYIQTR